MSNELNQVSDCQQIVESLLLMIDQEQCPVSTEAIEQHLAECLSCCAERDTLALVKSLIARSCCQEQAPLEVRVKITQLITQIHFDGSNG